MASTRAPRVAVISALISYNADDPNADRGVLGARVDGFTYIFLTNLEAEPRGWPEVRRVPVSDDDRARRPTVLAKRIKWRAWEFLGDEFDVVFWVDSHLAPKAADASAWRALAATLLERRARGELPLVTTRHPERDCVYEEARAVVAHRKDDDANVRRSLSTFVTERMPRHFGLAETCFLGYCPADPMVRAISAAVMTRVRNLSHRDQLAFTPALSSLGLTFDAVLCAPRSLMERIGNRRKHVYASARSTVTTLPRALKPVKAAFSRGMSDASRSPAASDAAAVLRVTPAPPTSAAPPARAPLPKLTAAPSAVFLTSKTPAAAGSGRLSKMTTIDVARRVLQMRYVLASVGVTTFVPTAAPPAAPPRRVHGGTRGKLAPAARSAPARR